MKCKVCGKNAEKEYCFQHKPRKPLPKTSAIKKSSVQSCSNEVHEFFQDLWKKRRHYSEISGIYLGSEPLSVYFHHILPKSKYPESALDEENIILLTLDEHTNVESDIYRYEEINNRRKYLLTKYERA